MKKLFVVIILIISSFFLAEAENSQLYRTDSAQLQAQAQVLQVELEQSKAFIAGFSDEDKRLYYQINTVNEKERRLKTIEHVLWVKGLF